jgi:hypothetical protein
MARLAILLVGLMLLTAGAYAAVVTPQIGGGIGQFDGGVSSPAVAAGPQPTGKILLADGVSFLLLTDGVSKLCRAGGC